LKVDFIIVGAQKCGTTTLARILEQHPNISFCNKKEPNFWCATTDWKRDIDQYHNRYTQKENVLYGEASTSYTFLPLYNSKNRSQISVKNKWGDFSANKLPFKVINTKIPSDLFEYNPEMKIIYIVRNPFERIVSAYKHFYDRAYIDKKINDAILEDSVLVDLSRYYTQIKPYIKVFGRENILLLNFDDLRGNQRKVKKQLVDFLDIENDDFLNSEDLHSNKSSVFRPPYYLDKLPYRLQKLITRILNRKNNVVDPMSTESKRLINYLLDDEISKIGQLMNEDLNHWMK